MGPYHASVSDRKCRSVAPTGSRMLVADTKCVDVLFVAWAVFVALDCLTPASVRFTTPSGRLKPGISAVSTSRVRKV